MSIPHTLHAAHSATLAVRATSMHVSHTTPTPKTTVLQSDQVSFVIYPSHGKQSHCPRNLDQNRIWVTSSSSSVPTDTTKLWELVRLPLHNLRKKRERGGKKTRNIVSYPKYYFMLCGFIGCETPSPPPSPLCPIFQCAFGAIWHHLVLYSSILRSVSPAFYL